MHRLLSLYNAFYIYAFPSDHLILDNKLIVLFFSGEDYYSCFQHSLKACCFCIRWRPYWLSPFTLTSLLLSLSMSCLCSHVAEALWVWHLLIWTQSVNAFCGYDSFHLFMVVIFFQNVFVIMGFIIQYHE